MTKSELIEIISAKQKHLPAKDVELAVKQLLEIMSDALATGERIEIRGFGSFSLHFRPPRQGSIRYRGEEIAGRAEAEDVELVGGDVLTLLFKRLNGIGNIYAVF